MASCARATTTYQFRDALSAIVEFCNVDLSAFYVDVRKDALYCDAPSSARRRACRSALDEVFSRLTAWLAPILPFTMEEAWLTRFPDDVSVHLRQFPETPESWRDDFAARGNRAICVEVRAVCHRARLKWRGATSRSARRWKRRRVCSLPIERLRASLQAIDFAELCITSGVTHRSGRRARPRRFVWRKRRASRWSWRRRAGVKCARSWKYFDPATADPRFPDITPRDARSGARRGTRRMADRARLRRSLPCRGRPAPAISPAMFRFGLLLAAMVFIADQISKYIILESAAASARRAAWRLAIGCGFIELSPLFDLHMVWNRGVSFGMLRADADIGALGRWWRCRSGFPACSSGGCRSAERKLTAIALGLVVGGALGNVIDRIRFGAVADFLDFNGFWFPWVFNVADAAITVGAVLLAARFSPATAKDKPAQPTATNRLRARTRPRTVKIGADPSPLLVGGLASAWRRARTPRRFEGDGRPMTKPIMTLVAILAAASCGQRLLARLSRSLGAGKTSPDEFRVVTARAADAAAGLQLASAAAG